MEMNKQYNKAKKQNLKKELERSINELIDVLDKADSLDYFTIEIKKHEHRLDVDCILKNRKKVYW